jgi:toxin ParE1/3/4
MARFRLARPAQIDLANILATSAERWGAEGRQRYAAVLAAAMRQVAEEQLPRPYARRAAEGPRVRRPVHVLYYRVAEEGVIEIIQVLHERMEPSRDLDERPTEGDI